MSDITGRQQQGPPKAALLPKPQERIDLQNEYIEIHINKLGIIEAELGNILKKTDDLQKDLSELLLMIDSFEVNTLTLQGFCERVKIDHELFLCFDKNNKQKSD